jgi:beta-galactosidase
MNYSQEVIHIDIDGPLDLIGPKSLPLTGGSTGFFVKTKQAKGTATIRVSSDNFDIKEIKIEVK